MLMVVSWQRGRGPEIEILYETEEKFMNAIVLDMQPFIKTSDDFFDLCAINRDMKLERKSTGEIIIRHPAGGITGSRNLGIGAQLWYWNEQAELGIAFDSSTGFTLDNGADRSPDAAWICQVRWDTLTPNQRQKFVLLCPDFVIELHSPSDNLKPLQEKMVEYIANGTLLGWLINPQKCQVEIYRPNMKVEVLNNPQELIGDPELSGFILNMRKIWSK